MIHVSAWDGRFPPAHGGVRSCVDADLALSFGLVRLGPLALTLRRSVRAAGCASRAGIQLVQQSQVQKRVEHRRWQAVSALAHVLCDDAHGLKGHLAPLVVVKELVDRGANAPSNLQRGGRGAVRDPVCVSDFFLFCSYLTVRGASRDGTHRGRGRHPHAGHQRRQQVGRVVEKGLADQQLAHALDGQRGVVRKLLQRPGAIGRHFALAQRSAIPYRSARCSTRVRAALVRTQASDGLPWPASPLDLTREPLTFEAPDPVRFPALRIAKAALLAGGGAPAAMNGADEVAVAAFLGGRIGFLDIAATVEETLTRMDRQNLLRPPENDPVEAARITDATARRVAKDVVSGLLAPIHA